jgi:hypothetical protein
MLWQDLLHHVNVEPRRVYEIFEMFFLNQHVQFLPQVGGSPVWHVMQH